MFKISEDAKKWLQAIDIGTEAKVMDYYHMCAILGLHMILKNSGNFPDRVERCEGGAFYPKTYPKAYRKNRFAVIALFLEAELNRQNIVNNGRKNTDGIKDFINKRLDGHCISHLSIEGIDFMNRYSYMGYLELRKTIPEKPTDTILFIIAYSKILNKYL